MLRCKFKTKFYKLHSFRENDYFDEDAMLVTIIKNDVMDLASISYGRPLDTGVKSDFPPPFPSPLQENSTNTISAKLIKLITCFFIFLIFS